VDSSKYDVSQCCVVVPPPNDINFSVQLAEDVGMSLNILCSALCIIIMYNTIERGHIAHIHKFWLYFHSVCVDIRHLNYIIEQGIFALRK